jgi:hypothetical protein
VRTSKKVKIGGLGVVLAGAIMQFFQPAPNIDPGPYLKDISNVVAVPDSIHHLLKIGCYDCHSNHTSYPSYSKIQPGGWYLTRHITKGKAELNFHLFASYSKRKQRSKLKAIIGQLNDGEMPLSSYKLLHPEARFSPKQQQAIIEWAEHAADSLAL